MDCWLKFGSLKKTVKTFVAVAPAAVETSTTNSVEEDGAIASTRIAGPDVGFWNESVTVGAPEPPVVLDKLPTSSETSATEKRTVKRKYHHAYLEIGLIETSENKPECLICDSADK
uniref:Uncharacterized protein n=1 Tax=Sphaerodactylus townsendi TaxID=933632 RepID=A0ACB8ERB9_9SAUR